jgi:hypothetical protein
VVTHKPGTAWVIPRLLDLKQRYNPKAIMINSNGPAGRAGGGRTAGVGLKLVVNGPEWQRACAAFVAMTCRRIR